jgi:DNA-directed RNA polymerase specialized sigma24 family protein
MDADTMADTEAAPPDHELLAAERHAALRQAVSDLPPGYKELIILLNADPPVSYAEISAKLGIPIGSIGPSRSRCLARLRRHPAIAELIDADAQPIACGDAP